MIYIPDSDIWESIQKVAKEEGRSVSNYLVQLHKESQSRSCHVNLSGSIISKPEISNNTDSPKINPADLVDKAVKMKATKSNHTAFNPQSKKG